MSCVVSYMSNLSSAAAFREIVALPEQEAPIASLDQEGHPMSFMRNNSNNTGGNMNRTPGEAEVVTPPFRPSFGNTDVEPSPEMPSSMMDDAARARVFERDPRTMATPPERCADFM